MRQKIIELAINLINFRSIEGENKELGDILEFVLKYFPDFKIERFEKNSIKSALVYNKNKRPEKFDILLNCHLDIIPAKDFQYKAKIKGDKLIGAGAYDMKGNVSASIFAFLEVAKNIPYSLAIQFTTDEEIGGFNGTKFQVEENGVKADIIIATEPTNLNIVHKAKGVLWIDIIFYGKTAHGAYPYRGINAIEKANNFISKIKNIIKNPKESSWQTSCNFVSIETENKVYNKIPDKCKVSLDIRYIFEDKEKIIKEIENILEEKDEYKIIAKEPPIFVKENENFIKQICNSTKKIANHTPTLYAAQGTSDGRHFSEYGGKSIEFGAFGGGIGQDDEWVSISGLENYYKILCDFLKNYKRN